MNKIIGARIKKKTNFLAVWYACMYQIFNLLDDSAGENARVNKVTDQFHLRFISIV